MKKRNIVVANWKMNPEKTEEAKNIFLSIKRFSAKLKRTEVIVAPSFVHTAMFGKLAKGKKLSLGAQNAHSKNSGSYTGETSASQLKNLGVKYVILGHSERRTMGEDNSIINLKLKNVLANGLTAILCVGEKERDKDGAYLQFVRQELTECLQNITKKDLLSIIIAYEPIWAIGKSFRESMSGTDMHEMSIFIRKTLTEIFGQDYGWSARILYGGSVEPENAESIMAKGEISGFLVGHESLIPEDFKKILKTADSAK